jgi:hypothetical protein
MQGSRLQLSRLLAGLRDTAEARTREAPAVRDPDEATAKAADHDRDGKLTMREVVEHTRHAGFGFLIAFLALIAIPFFGLSTPFGLAIALLGGQMLRGRQQPWLPRRVADRVVGARTLRWLSSKLARWTRWLETVVKPRWRGLTDGRAYRATGLGVLVLGLGLALPIPIPGSNWVFLAPLLVYAIGLLEDDGALIAIGHAATITIVGLSVAFSHLIAAGLQRVWHWIT